jgi:hypothetical protein
MEERKIIFMIVCLHSAYRSDREIRLLLVPLILNVCSPLVIHPGIFVTT